jgi:hypothetical protein
MEAVSASTARAEGIIMRRFEWVWLSTDAQLSTVVENYRRASLGTKLLGTYKFRNDAAHARGLLMPWIRVPLLFLSEGALAVTEHSIVFAGQRHRMFGWRMVGVRSDLQFEHSVSEITSVEVVDFSSPVAKLFNIPFTRVRTDRAAPFDDFLLCVGGRISIPPFAHRA